MEAADDLSEWVCHYGSLYGPQIVLLATLSAITIYRREMSCNHCYAEGASHRRNYQQQTDRRQQQSLTTTTSRQWDEIEAENLLDGVGLYCSGASLLPVVMHLLCVWKETDLCASSEATEEMLEHAGNFFSGEPLASALLGLSGCSSTCSPPRNILKKTPAVSLARFLSPSCSTEGASRYQGYHHYELFADYLPIDLQIQVCSFLTPRDVVRWAQVNRACRATVETSHALWKALFDRDYGWTVTVWDVGRQAVRERSLVTDLASVSYYDKEFYFRFGLAFCDYMLAGQNTVDRCLVALGGHVYDMTAFVHVHPGSPETVLVSAGKDATQFFTNVRHSSGALRFAKSLCVVVDASRRSKRDNPGHHVDVVGMFPTRHTALQAPERNNVEAVRKTPACVEPDLMDLQELRINSAIGTEAPHWIRESFLTERKEAEERVRRSQHVREERLTDINVYFDPFSRIWKAWYTNPQMESIFVGDI